jgi:hypothetical protein
MAQVIIKRNPKPRFRCQTNRVRGWMTIYRKDCDDDGKIKTVFFHLQQRPESIEIGKIENLSSISVT